MPTGPEIREKFLRFFEEKGHRRVHSSSLVPHNDPTLLFTNAGMNQFKDVFLGLEKRDYTRATTSQKCVRAGGKHNDLENVGFTNRHHTFFEMLGNFSFGDYFKKDAIAYAWELITSPQWYGIEKEKLYVTIFKGESGVPRDAEAYDLWAAQGVPKERIYQLGMKDNFWQMGDTGPCGPCSEIHYDMGPTASDQGHTDCQFGCDCGRYVEIWNLVFMQFDRDAGGKLNPLPKPSIDTGMGLERVTAVLQGKISNYDTDLFSPLTRQAALLTAPREGDSDCIVAPVASMRVIADHSRAATFLISDGVLPSNEGRGYVLRKIIRRAITHGRLVGQTKPFLHQMTFAVRDLMVEAYPELIESADRASKVILSEEIRFERTLGEGLKRLETLIDESISIAQQQWAYPPNLNLPMPPAWVSGKDAFKLYDTFGLPLDFIKDAIRDRGVNLNEPEFEQALLQQRERTKASWRAISKQSASPVYRELPKSEFEGYRQTRSEHCEVLAIIHNGQGVQELKPGQEGEVILDHTPFYAESGGQVGDRGIFYSDELNAVVAEVKGCYYPVQGVRAHQVVMKSFGTSTTPPSAKNAEGWGTLNQVDTRLPHPSPSGEGGGFTLRIGDKIDAVVNADIRQATMRNHTATHLLQAGLREVLGKHVKQAGSLVAPNHLRFDFSHFTGVQDEELQDIEDLINKEVLRNEKIEVIENVPIDVAINEYKAMALFGEKYGDKVRVIKIGDFSTELCGGTHTAQTGEIGLIKILKEGSVSSGVRRVEAVTGERSLQHFRKDHQLENVVASLATHAETASPAEALKAELDKKDAEIKRLTRELDQARMKSASASSSNIGEKIKDVKGVKVLAHRVDNLERAQMRTLVDQLRDKVGSGVVVLGSATDGAVSLIVGVTKDLTSRVQAGKVISPVAQKVGGKGGGRPDLAEAGGKDPASLDSALNDAYAVVEQLLV